MCSVLMLLDVLRWVDMEMGFPFSGMNGRGNGVEVRRMGTEVEGGGSYVRDVK